MSHQCQPTKCHHCGQQHDSQRQLSHKGCASCGRRSYPYHALRTAGKCAVCGDVSGDRFLCKPCAEYKRDEQRKWRAKCARGDKLESLIVAKERG